MNTQLPDDAPHAHREIAESFGIDAEAYDRHRPRYPQALADRIVAELPDRSILDVGMGTGLSALPFRQAGCRVLGVEPDSRMAEIARRRGFEVELARFEEWDAVGRTVGGVIAGQTWHWIDPVAGAAKAREVLAPDGLLAVFWNAGDPPAQIVSAFADVYRSVNTGLPFTPWAGETSAVAGYEKFLDTAAGGMTGAGGFGKVERIRVDWQATIGRQDWLDQVPTSGGHGNLPPQVLDELLTKMGAVIDAAGGAFTMNYATVGVVAHRA